MKKRLLCTILTAILLIANISLAHAYTIGDVIGETLYTDIVASINNYNILSHNYNGYTMIVAEDLRNFGFDVVWDGVARTLSINRNPAVTGISSTYTAPTVSKDILFTKSHDVLYTDIRTFVQGREVPSHNLGGITIVNFEDLRPFGEIVYNNTTRTLDLTINGLSSKTPSVKANVSNSNKTTISNWSNVSPVQQFKYLNEGLAYAYKTDSILHIVTSKKKLQIEAPYPSLGDVISDNDGNFYVVWGKENTEQTNSTETVFISKYSPDGNHIKTTGFVGKSVMGEDGNTRVPFAHGNCSSAIANNRLMVNYARSMYNGHQSNNVIGVYIHDMSPINFNSVWDIPYTSHSFNQRVIWSTRLQDFIYADHGDAYDRGFVISSGNTEKRLFTFYLPANANYDMFVVNKTYAQLGSLVETNRGVALIGASAKSIGESATEEKQNLFVQIFDPTATEITNYMFVGGEPRSGSTSFDINDNQNSPLSPVTDYGVQWITNYSDRDVIAPHAVAAKDRIVILWNERNGHDTEAFYTVLSSDGKILTPATSLGKDCRLNSYEDPIYHEGKIYWACSNNGIINVESIEL